MECNFLYVLPPDPNSTENIIELVVPSALQMVWTESPSFFCTASETARDNADERYGEEKGSLPENTLENLMMPPKDWD